MKILIFDKSPEIGIQIERNISSVNGNVSVSKVDNINAVINDQTLHEFNMIIIDGDNLEGKFKTLVEVVRKTGNEIHIFLFFSFNIKSITDKFISNGADYCFDKLCGFEIFMEIFKSISDRYNNQNATNGVQCSQKEVQ